MNEAPITTPDEIAFGNLALSIRKCEAGDEVEFGRARRLQKAIDADMIEIGDYDAGILTYKLTDHGLRRRAGLRAQGMLQ